MTTALSWRSPAAVSNGRETTRGWVSVRVLIVLLSICLAQGFDCIIQGLTNELASHRLSSRLSRIIISLHSSAIHTYFVHSLVMPGFESNIISLHSSVIHTYFVHSLVMPGFESPDRPEAFRSFLALLTGASSRYSDTIGKLGNATAAAKYRKMADDLTSRIRGGSDWHAAWGMHASADAINAGIVQPSEVAAMLDEANGVLGDPLQVHVCSRVTFSANSFGSVLLSCGVLVSCRLVLHAQ